MGSASPKGLATVPQPSQGEAALDPQLPERLADQILEFAPLEQVPEPIRGIEVRGIGRQALHLEPLAGLGLEEGFDRLGVMDRGTVPEDEQLAGNMVEEMAQEAHDGRTADRFIVHATEHPTVLGDGSNQGEMVVTEGGAQDRGLPARRPGPHQGGQQIHPGFIYPDDRATVCFGLFLSAGQRSSHQAWIAAWSRWLARWTGFCTLHPSWRRRRLTWAG